MKLVFLLLFLVFGVFSMEKNDINCNDNFKDSTMCAGNKCCLDKNQNIEIDVIQIPVLETDDCENVNNPENLQKNFTETMQNGSLKEVKLLPENVGGLTLTANAAALYGRTDVFEFLYHEDNSDLNQTNSFGETLVWIAAREGHIEVVKFLADKADLNRAEKNGKTPVYISAENGYTEIVEFLADKVDLNQAENSGKTPVYIAAEKGHTEIVEFLADKVDLNQVENSGKTPLYIAAEKGHDQIVKVLIKKNVKLHYNFLELATTETEWPISDRLQRDFTETVQNGSLNEVKSLPEQNIVGLNLARTAALYGRTEVFEFLYEKNADLNQPNDFGETPVWIAAREGHIEVVKFLAKKVDLNQEISGRSLVWIAKEKGHTEIVEFLKEKKAKLERKLLKTKTNEMIDEPRKNKIKFDPNVLEINCTSGYNHILKDHSKISYLKGEKLLKTVDPKNKIYKLNEELENLTVEKHELIKEQKKVTQKSDSEMTPEEKEAANKMTKKISDLQTKMEELKKEMDLTGSNDEKNKGNNASLNNSPEASANLFVSREEMDAKIKEKDEQLAEEEKRSKFYFEHWSDEQLAERLKEYYINSNMSETMINL